MFNKINVCKIIKEHYLTLYRTKNTVGEEPISEASWYDICLFVGIPFLVLIGIVFSFHCYPIRVSELVLTIISASSAAFFALMLTALFSIVDRSEKLRSSIDEHKNSSYCIKKLIHHKKIFKELYFNVSYSMIVALFLIILSIVTAVFIPEKNTPTNVYYSFLYTFFSGIVIAVGLNLILTLLMIIKRIYHVFEPDDSN